MENISTIRKLTAFLLRQVAFYLTLLADILDKNDIIENRESRGLEIDKLENKVDYQMRENEEVIERNSERQIFGFNSREKEINRENEINRESESDPVDCENLQIRTTEYGDTEICEIKNDFGRERKDTVLSTDSGIDTVYNDFLQDFVTGKDPETGLDLICLDEVSYHNTREDAWIVIYDKVFEMTDYLEEGGHPGGEDVILEYLGYDATLAFRGVNHSKSALHFLEKYCIGILPSEERLNFTSE